MGEVDWRKAGEYILPLPAEPQPEPPPAEPAPPAPIVELEG
jgi:hypothetical protein